MLLSYNYAYNSVFVRNGLVPETWRHEKAYKRVEETGKVYSDASKKYNHDELENEEDGNIWNFLVPMVVLVAVTIISNDVLVAVVIALAVCFVMFVPRRLLSVEGFFASMIRGFGDMLPTLSLLLITFVLKDISGQMGMTDFMIKVAEPFLFASIFPAAVFVLGALLAFTTGSDWGMSSIITPIVFPLGAALGANPVLIWQRSYREEHLEAMPASMRMRHCLHHSRRALIIWNMR